MTDKRIFDKRLQENPLHCAICRIFPKPARYVLWEPWNINSTKPLIGHSVNPNADSNPVYPDCITKENIKPQLQCI